MRELGIDLVVLDTASLTYATGIGGRVGYFAEEAEIRFIDSSGESVSITTEIGICQENLSERFAGVPSLLGRDILNLFSVRLDYSSNLVLLE